MKRKKNPPEPEHHEQNFPVVGIGASAGGLEAFKQFLSGVPVTSGMAYILIQHLSPTHESLLPDLLQRITDIPVHTITDDINIAPDNVYVIPANKVTIMVDGKLKLIGRDMKANNAIDIFMTTLAEVHQTLAIGILLSGTGSDGRAGLKAVKDGGGFTIAQDQTAEYFDMPRSAITAGVVDFVLPVPEMPAKLLELAKTYKISDPEALLKEDEVVYKQIILLLRQRSTVDFTYYKQTTIRRRIARRMAITKCDTLGEYFRHLRSSKGEQDSLFYDVLIPVTSFFRDPKIFQILRDTIFPAMVKNKDASGPLRIWVAGCSTGEEAYSFAIMLRDILGENMSTQVKIFATDISATVIAKARLGVYHKAELDHLPDNAFRNHFVQTSEGYQVSRQIRDMCVFAVHNFLKDPPFARMDLISCRNVMIYMETFLQKKALATFHYALHDAGYLLLGKSETTSPAVDLFAAYNRNDKIYTRKAVPARFIPNDVDYKDETLQEKDRRILQPEVQQTDFRKSAEAMLLSRYTPASVIINGQLDIVHIHGNIGPFLEFAHGKPTFNVLKMAREGLSFELRSAIQKAREKSEPIRKEDIPLRSEGSVIAVTVEVAPLTNTVDPYFMIVFTQAPLPDLDDPDVSVDPGTNKVYLQRIQQLEKELAQVHEDVRAITEYQEASNEELQSANEELLSGSEELQSLNEEMETSKEELQSSNEELIIINQELIEKQEQINASRLFTEAIVLAMREPLVVLDRELRIKLVNAAFARKFAISEADANGRRIYEIRDHLFDDMGFRKKLENVLYKKTEVIDYEVSVHISGADSLMLINAGAILQKKENEQMILITMYDITERKKADIHIKALAEELEEKVKERTLELEQTNMQLEQFAHTASHELQEPLRKISTFATVLTGSYEDSDTPTVMDYLRKIGDSSARVSQLLQHLLDFATITHYEKLYEKTDLNEILRNILSDFELLIAEKNAKIIVDKMPVIEAVPFQMNQLIYELISNALKFTRPNVVPEIRISSQKLKASELEDYPSLALKATYYKICVKDNGIGFPQKYAQKVFTMFQKLNTGNAYAGTGIGLAICKKIVLNYHGHIYAEAKEGRGASFYIILPALQSVKGITPHETNSPMGISYGTDFD